MKDYLDYCNAATQADSNCDSCSSADPSVYTGLSKLPKNPVSAMAYVPFQIDTTTYEADEALRRGTLFPDLYKPFLGGKCI